MVTINGTTYSLKHLELTDSYVMERNGEAIWLMDKRSFEDFLSMFACTITYQKFIGGQLKTDL